MKKSLIGSQNVLNFAYALYLALRERKESDALVEKIVRRWLLLSILTGRYSGSPESMIDYDIKRFFAYPTPMEYLKVTEDGDLSDAFWKVTLLQKLDTSVASSPYFNIFLAAQAKEHYKGFLSEHVEVYSMLENRGDIHHLFPKKYLMKYGMNKSQYNQIANYVFIKQEINIKISDQAPNVYMKEVFEQCETGKPLYGGIVDIKVLKNNLSQNCVPEEFKDMDINDYQAFLVKRRELMAQLIKKYYDSL